MCVCCGPHGVVWVLQTVRLIQQDDSYIYWMRQQLSNPPPCGVGASLERGRGRGRGRRRRRGIGIPGRHRWMTACGHSYALNVRSFKWGVWKIGFYVFWFFFFFYFAKVNRRAAFHHHHHHHHHPPQLQQSADSCGLTTVKYQHTNMFIDLIMIKGAHLVSSLFVLLLSLNLRSLSISMFYKHAV